MLRNKRLTLSLLLAAALAIVFLTQSRVPALSEKAQMGLRTEFNEIAFDTILPVAADQALIERVLRSAANWAWTNWKGMTFGLLFAAAALLILSSLRRRHFKSPWLNTLFGAAAGAPLGVCVNCATPIAQGIYSAGARLETALATLIASPTLNVIVLTMSFAVLPWEIATAKLLGVFMLLAMVPILVKRYSPNQPANEVTRSPVEIQNIGEVPDMRSHETWSAAACGAARDYAKHLGYIIRLALPLMLLAGLLGAIVVEVVPFDLFVTQTASVGLILLAAAVATLLPVPIAFDVIIVSALLAGGADAGIATAILFALGIYSIYPALVIAKEASVRLSAALAVSVTTIALILAVATQGFSAADIESERRIIAQGLLSEVYEAYDDAMQICAALPDELHERCFAEQLPKFSPYIDENDLCDVRPAGLSAGACTELVSAAVVSNAAINERDVARCAQIEDPARRNECEFSIILRRAVDVHDVSECHALKGAERIAACRTQFISSSLLFNPDNSVCRTLTGGELADCQLNARVYRLAETMNFSGCQAFRTSEQREFCVYVIASTMIGRQNDPSGCTQLRTASLIERCRSQVIAWQAQRQRLPEHCVRVTDASIRTTCHLRVAGLRIDALLSGATLAQHTGDSTATTISNSAELPDPEAAPAFTWSTVYSDEQIEIRATTLKSDSTQHGPRFRQVAANDVGIENPWQFRITDFFEPFIVGKGVASGDFNNDFWPDLVFATDTGIALYQNTGGRFTRAPVLQDELSEKNIFVVAFVDADNDGLSDIYATSYGGDNYLLLNSEGSFRDAQLVKLPGQRRLTFAAGFADLNEDNLPDIVQGNWTSGVERLFSPDQSSNEILFSDSGSYRVELPEEVVGESLSVLLSDFDADNDTDLIIANDRIVPDMFYINDGNGGLQLMDPDSGFVPITSMFTMSLDAADFNNDLVPDLFSTDMTFARSSHENYCETVQANEDRSECLQLLEAYQGLRDGSALVCSELRTNRSRQDCFAAFAMQAAKNLKDSSYCEQLSSTPAAVRSLCYHLASPVPPEESLNQSEYVPQVQRNVLLIGSDTGFTEEAELQGTDSSYWSWNGKAADLDNDGWQDIYVGNGFHFGDNFYEIQENQLFRNIDGKQFEESAAEWGLNDPLNTPSYTYIDLDRDNDLDIVATGVLAPPRIFVNENQVSRAISIRLIDEVNNSAGIGAVITIGYGGSARLQQMREIRLSGGFLSFDEPAAHFGLGGHPNVDYIEIRWPDGQVNRIDSEIMASTLLQIRRYANP